MKNLLLASLMLGICAEMQAQDGDHPITDGAGRTYLATDANVLDAFGNPVAPFNMTIGLTPTNGATLRVRGDDTELPVLDLDPLQANMRCTFRTDVTSARPQSWRTYRDVNRIGAIWNESLNLAWHIQSLAPRDIGQDRYSGVNRLIGGA